jgi:hypothetical protein
MVLSLDPCPDFSNLALLPEVPPNLPNLMGLPPELSSRSYNLITKARRGNKRSLDCPTIPLIPTTTNLITKDIT